MVSKGTGCQETDETKLGKRMAAARQRQTTLKDERHVERGESALWHDGGDGEGRRGGRCRENSGLYAEEEGESRAVLLSS